MTGNFLNNSWKKISFHLVNEASSKFATTSLGAREAETWLAVQSKLVVSCIQDKAGERDYGHSLDR